jgi:charged multivesicular body protein 2A
MSFISYSPLITVLDVMKEYQRTLNRSIRELERERGRLEQQEKKIILDIKKAAKENQLVRY